ncbi:hypothetical protein LC574_09935, partial [Nostoc sp. CHAB 5715]|nr:hypothetical protein [Nostoc sp. CHAB 5715]
GIQTGPDGLGEVGHICDATILTRQDIGVSNGQYHSWQAAGFYAVAYNWNGQTVISYRVTDAITSRPWSDDPGSDPWNAEELCVAMRPPHQQNQHLSEAKC